MAGIRSALRDTGNGWWALSRLTATELLRQRLWLLILLAVIGLGIGISGIDAADAADRRKLAVSMVTGGIGFLLTLIALLAGAQMVRRDIESRIGFTLFAKPISKGTYVGGRWTGLTVWLVVVAVLLALVGSVTLALTGSTTEGGLLQVRQPQAWQRLDAFSRTVPDQRQTLTLSGAPGDAVRARFDRLATDAPNQVRIRAAVRGALAWQPTDQALVRVRARPALDADPVILSLAPTSPYGESEGPTPVADAIIVRNHDNRQPAFDVDYARLQLPPEAVGADGTTWVEVIRLDDRATLRFETEHGIILAEPGGGMALNMARAALVQTASAAVLVAAAIFFGTVSNIGVALLGGFAVWFGGHAHGLIDEAVRRGKLPQAAERLVQLIQYAIPDFTAFPIAADLAAGQAVGWSVVVAAWLLAIPYILMALVAALLVLRRSEL